MTEEKAVKSVGKKLVVCLILVFLVLAAAAYFIGVYYFSNHFLPGSKVNGFNCSYMTVQETEELLAKSVDAFVLEVRTRGNGVEGISAAQADLHYVSDGSVEELMKKQDRYKWFLAFNQNKSYEVERSIEYDKDKLIETVRQLDCMQEENNIPPADAYIKENASGFEIVPEVEGTTLKRKAVQKLVAKAMTTGTPSVDLEEAGCYLAPKVYRDDKTLNKECKQINRLTGVVITYDFADRTETVDKDVIKNWLVKNKKGNYTLDKEKVAAFVNELGYKYDTFGCTRTFITYDGREKTIQGGDYRLGH